MARPGQDTREWASFGIVDGDPPVEFDVEDGQVYVNVRLEPAKLPCRCRMGARVAGKGEGEYFPFLNGDEVLVILPNGSARAGGVVTERLSNSYDKFPMESVAGQDPKTNAFAFRRRRTPVVEELAGPIIFRSAETGALISVTEGITLKDSENSTLQISADAITLQGPSDDSTPPKFLLQINLTEERGLLQVNDAQFLLNGSGAPDKAGEAYLVVPNGFTVAIGSNPAVEHVATVEFVLMILCAAFGAQVVPPVGATALAALTASLTAGGVPTGPGLIAWQAMQATYAAALAKATAKPPVNPATGVQAFPGVGVTGFLTG